MSYNNLSNIVKSLVVAGSVGLSSGCMSVSKTYDQDRIFNHDSTKRPAEVLRAHDAQFNSNLSELERSGNPTSLDELTERHQIFSEASNLGSKFVKDMGLPYGTNVDYAMKGVEGDSVKVTRDPNNLGSLGNLAGILSNLPQDDYNLILLEHGDRTLAVITPTEAISVVGKTIHDHSLSEVIPRQRELYSLVMSALPEGNSKTIDTVENRYLMVQLPVSAALGSAFGPYGAAASAAGTAIDWAVDSVFNLPEIGIGGGRFISSDAVTGDKINSLLRFASEAHAVRKGPAKYVAIGVNGSDIYALLSDSQEEGKISFTDSGFRFDSKELGRRSLPAIGAFIAGAGTYNNRSSSSGSKGKPQSGGGQIDGGNQGGPRGGR